jgi:O-methyltransferase involved in polyketide biosynthesis
MDFSIVSSTFEALEDLPRTLLIPLSARAHGPKVFPTLNPEDQYAEALLSAAGIEARTTTADAPVMLNVLWRTQLIKQLGQAFFERHPDSTGVNLGAGLAHYFQWLRNEHNRWVDADLPEVIGLRQSLIPQTSKRCKNQALDLTQPGWWSCLEAHKGQAHQPVLLVCEGVLMYLPATQVRAILREIADNAPDGSELLVDFVSPLSMGLQASSASSTAKFQWGVHNGLEIAQIHPRLELIAQRSVSEAYGWGACVMEMCCSPFTGGPLYGLAHLRVVDND